MYDRSTAYYDLIYRDLKDYAEETRRIDALLQRIEPKPKRLLDVGCGTGEHAYLLRREHGYEADGVDIQPGFVKIAQSKSPDAHFEVADMCALELERRYDAILCLFSSIGYVETMEGMRNALASFARHLVTGGWLVLEPWITPDNWRPGQVDTVEATDPETGGTVQRIRTGSTDGHVSVIEIDYHVKTGGEEHTFSEQHRLGMFTKDEMQAALEESGFRPNWMPVGLQLQPIVVAQLAER